MIHYISTRGGVTEKDGLTSADAIRRGLAPDGGLFMPDTIPTLTKEELTAMVGMTYAQRASLVMSKFLTDYSKETLDAYCADAYSEARFPGGSCPLHRLNDQTTVLELWHGPTCAFKDMALQMMPKLLSGALKITGEKRTALILVATSGDTGKAALEGYRDADQVKIMVYYPVDGVSDMQKRQMATQEGNNVRVCAIRGNFDDAQSGVKAIFSDKSAAEELEGNNCFFSSANSINWGRLVPQVAYYVSAYCDLVAESKLKMGEEICFSVPTGNFGNIFAGYLAKQMGLPVKRFLCASNKNNILTDFFRSGVYDRNRSFYTTMSPSMDILISSNLERLLYLMAGTEATAAWMKSLSETGRYEIPAELLAKLQETFVGYCCDEEYTAAVIADTFDRYGYLIDPHTAVGVSAEKQYRMETADTVQIVVDSTASPYKFAANVYRSLTGKNSTNEFETLKELSAYSHTAIPAPLAALEHKAVRFTQVIDPADMRAETVAFSRS